MTNCLSRMRNVRSYLLGARLEVIPDLTPVTMYYVTRHMEYRAPGIQLTLYVIAEYGERHLRASPDAVPECLEVFQPLDNFLDIMENLIEAFADSSPECLLLFDPDGYPS